MGEHRHPKPPVRPRYREVTVEPEPGAVIPWWYWPLSPFQVWHASGGRVTPQEQAWMHRRGGLLALTLMAAIGSL